MDDDHEFPVGHMARCAEALAVDPHSVWIIGEFKPWEVVRPPVGSPGQLNARGFSSAPVDHQRCWAISDGATIYPRSIFTSGQRFADDFKFGAAFLEFGSRLYWLGYRMRLLDSTWIIHHMDRKNRSFMDEEADCASSAFAMYCHALMYQPSARNKLCCLFEVAKRFCAMRGCKARSILAGWHAYRRRCKWEPTPTSQLLGAEQIITSSPHSKRSELLAKVE